MEKKLSSEYIINDLRGINEKISIVTIIVIAWFIIWIVLTILKYTIFK